jgi:hypothetical protein
MSFRTLGKEPRLPQSVVMFVRRLRAPWRGPARSTLRFALAILAIAPLAVVWYNPFSIFYAAAFLVLVWLVACYRQWAGWQHMGSFLAGALTLLIFWGSVFVVWLFLENDVYRVLLLAVLAMTSWWYLGEWQRVRVALFAGEAGAGAAPTLAVGFLASFCLTASAESFLVYLSTHVWVLLFTFFLPILVLLLTFVYTSGWSLVRHAPYWLTGSLVLVQVFLLGLWWPTSSYVIGFTMAVAFAAVALSLRQEAQGFINRRSFLRELAVLVVAWMVVLVGARWFS